MDSTLVGSFRLVHDDRTVWPEADDDSLYLENLGVRRAWSGRKIGRQLLLWAERKVCDIGKDLIRLDCFANNTLLRKYYEDAGYDSCGEIDAGYSFGTLRLQRYQKKLQRSTVYWTHKPAVNLPVLVTVLLLLFIYPTSRI